MEKKNLKQTERTIRKDRGDLRNHPEKPVKNLIDFERGRKVSQPDGGDVRPQDMNKTKLNTIKKPEENTDHNIYKRLDKEITFSRYKLNLDLDKNNVTKITSKSKESKANTYLSKKDETVKTGGDIKIMKTEVNDRSTKRSNCDKAKIESNSTYTANTINTENNKLETKNPKSVQRRPIIRTVTSKNDKGKIFKAVTFEEKKTNPTLLQIKIPSDLKNTKNSVHSDLPNDFTNYPSHCTNTVNLTHTVNRVCMTENMDKTKKKTKRKKRLVSSPDLAVKAHSPPTEVAKWAPSSVNGHTKPYYEAWVSTTLTAISKNAGKEKHFLEKQLQSLKQRLERPDTPELVYDNLDERYTGRIKVRQR